MVGITFYFLEINERASQCCDQSAIKTICQQTGPSADLRTVWQTVRERRPICRDFCSPLTFCWQNSVLPYSTITLIRRRPCTKQGRKRIEFTFLRISVWRLCAICVSVSADGIFSTAPLARHTEGCHRVCCRPHFHSWPLPHIVFVPRWIAGSAVLIFPAPLLCTFSCCSFFAHHSCFCHLHPPPSFPRDVVL